MALSHELAALKKNHPPRKHIIPHVANLQSSIPVVHHWSWPLCYIVAPDCIGETTADPRAHEIPASMEEWDEQEQGYWQRCPHRWCFLENFAEAEMSTECPFSNKKSLPFNRALGISITWPPASYQLALLSQRVVYKHPKRKVTRDHKAEMSKYFFFWWWRFIIRSIRSKLNVDMVAY